MCNVSEMEILKKDQREMLEIKNVITEMKNALGATSRLYTSEERISA